MILKILLLLIYCISPPCNAEEKSNTQEHKFDNGLKLIIREDHRAPSVVMQVWYKVGGSYEPNGMTGISHALEHMMFQGTTQYPNDQFTKLISISGGDQNAFTTNDYTAYFQELDPSRLALCFELEADRMVNLDLKKESFENELKVVMEERRLRIEDKPDALTFERLFAAAHISNPYHNPTIGWMNDIENLKVHDLEKWYKKWYGPNNAVVIVVGNIKSDEVLELAKTYFAPLKPINIPELKPRKESISIGTRRIQINANATVPRLFMSYNVPCIFSATDPTEPYALLVLMMALDGGNSARFSKELIREQTIATSIFSYYNPFALHETLMMFSAIPTKNHTMAELEQAFTKQIVRLQTELLSEQELKRIKTNVIAKHIFGKDSMTDQAIEIGSYEGIGLSWKDAEIYPEKIQGITAIDVQKVAHKYLVPERLTVAELIPSNVGN